jgi:hypothetical protein
MPLLESLTPRIPSVTSHARVPKWHTVRQPSRAWFGCRIRSLCWHTVAPLLHEREKSPKKSQNKAGMSIKGNDFHFWKSAKAGMFMKTTKLSKKAGMLLIINTLI